MCSSCYSSQHRKGRGRYVEIHLNMLRLPATDRSQLATSAAGLAASQVVIIGGGAAHLVGHKAAMQLRGCPAEAGLTPRQHLLLQAFATYHCYTCATRLQALGTCIIRCYHLLQAGLKYWTHIHRKVVTRTSLIHIRLHRRL